MDANGIQDLEGPFEHHVYIAHAFADKRAALDLRRSMEIKGLICCTRSLDCEIQASIHHGVTRSRKCLIFLTNNYNKSKENWYQIETETIIEKTERFCRDTLVIVKTESVKEVPEKLRGFKELFFKPEKLKDEKYMAQLVDILVQEPSASLTVLPKQNMGYGAAFGYFYGFLRLTLPNFKDRLIEETLKSNQDLLPNTIKKMLIIMPESCFCAIGMESPNRIEFTGKFVVRSANRAGNVKRDYKSSLYKLLDYKRNREYYFVGELATPLLTMYETYHHGLCGMTRDQLYTERDAFYFALKAILSHPDNAECNDQFRLLYWPDPDPDPDPDQEKKKPNGQELYDFLLPVLEKELELERQKVRNDLKLGKSKSVTSQSSRTNGILTFEALEVRGFNPSRIYESVDQYPMSRVPRGKCLIVNIANFDKGHVHLTPRRGAEEDERMLKKLFTDLHFAVTVHNDVNQHTLECLFLTMHLADHSNYDAFVCCIMTHGKLGVIYTSDGKPVEILQLVDYFTEKNCPSLRGKPKMFFIQACQKGVAESPSENGSSFPHDGTTTVGSDFQVQDDMKKLRVSQHPIESDDAPVNHFQTNSVQTDATSAPNISGLDESLPGTLNHKAVLVPGSPDFLMSYSTLPGSISYRDTQTGSLYVQALNDCMRKGYEIDRVLKQVSSRVKKNLLDRGEQDGRKDRFQLPFHLTSGMDRLIYLS